MRNLTLPILLVSSLAVTSVGCGNKAKKKTVATTPVVADAPGPSDENQAPESEVDTSATLEKVVYFAFDSSDLDDEARADLEENATWMKEDKSRVLTIEGHTDEAGTTDYNLALGERRARVTKEYVVRLGVDAARIQIITYGEERPAGSDDTLNRRSVFVATRK